MANLIFKKGSYADFKANVTTAQEGAFYVTEDEGGLYLGLADGSTKRLQGSVVFYNNIDDIVEAAGKPPYDPNVIYFSAANNALFRYDPSVNKWIQLNQTAESVTQALNVLNKGLSDLQTDLNSYKETNNAAVADKATKAELEAETERAKGEEAKNAKAAADAMQAAETAQGTADQAVAAAGVNSTAIGGLQDDLKKANDAIATKVTMAQVEAKDYATNAQVKTATGEVLGKATDSTDANTVYGVKNYVKGVESQLNTVKNTAEAALPKAGGAMTGNITMSAGTYITIPNQPEKDDQAANKLYVDTAIKTVNSTAGGLSDRLTQVEETVEGHSGQISTINSQLDVINQTTLPGLDGAVKKAQSTADDAAQAASAANANAETRVLQSEYDEAVEGLNGSISNINAKIGEMSTSNDNKFGEIEQTLKGKLDSSEAAKTYATKTELNTAKADLLGEDGDLSTADTIYGAKKGVAEAKADAASAQKLADTNSEAIGKLQGKATEIEDNVTANANSIKTINETLATKANQSALDSTNQEVERVEDELTQKIGEVKTTADNALSRAGGTMTGNITMSNDKTITGLPKPSAGSDAVNKDYADGLIAAADAMVFKGVLGGGVTALPTSGVQCGWTYKVGQAGTYSGISAKVGDLIINTAADNATPVWEHISSGYEDDYLQKLGTEGTDDVRITLDNGVGMVDTTITLKSANGISWTQSHGVITPSIVWGTF